MRSLCKDWTEGSPAAFAVLDGVGDVERATDQLCITQEGQTPFIGQWTTVSNWTTDGLALPVVDRTGRRSDPAGRGRLGPEHRAARRQSQGGGHRRDRASDQLALDQYLLPDLGATGVHGMVETIAANPTETRPPTVPKRPWSSRSCRRPGSNSVIPLMPFNAFFPVLQAETAAEVLPQAPPLGLRVVHRVVARADPVPLREGAQRPGGRDHRDAGRGRRLPARVPGRVRPGRAVLLRHLAQGVPRDPQGQHELLHRGAGAGPGLVPGDPAVRRGGQGGRART